MLILLAAGRSDGPTTVSAALAVSALSVGAWDVWRFSAPGSWPFSPDLWTYEHLAKMLGAYSAVLSAFSGNFLAALPAPWSQLWPTVLFQCLIVGWIATKLVRKRRSRILRWLGRAPVRVVVGAFATYSFAATVVSVSWYLRRSSPALSVPVRPDLGGSVLFAVAGRGRAGTG